MDFTRIHGQPRVVAARSGARDRKVPPTTERHEKEINRAKTDVTRACDCGHSELEAYLISSRRKISLLE